VAKYIARVELHDANGDDYETLHDSMANRGYGRTIVGDNGSTYQLPTGTYVTPETDATLVTAHNAAKEAADETGKSSAIIVASYVSARWSGLTIV